jgi:hypothetical protein
VNRQRRALVDRLESSGQDWLWYLEQLTADQVGQAALQGEWTVHQIAAHMRDTEQQVFLHRSKLILREDNARVENFDQEAWNRTHYSPKEPLRSIISQFRTARRQLVRLMRSSTPKDWDRVAIHPEYGRISLDWLTLHNYNHTLEHIAQVGQLREQLLLDGLNDKSAKERI